MNTHLAFDFVIYYGLKVSALCFFWGANFVFIFLWYEGSDVADSIAEKAEWRVIICNPEIDSFWEKKKKNNCKGRSFRWEARKKT